MSSVWLLDKHADMPSLIASTNSRLTASSASAKVHLGPKKGLMCAAAPMHQQVSLWGRSRDVRVQELECGAA